MFFYLRKRHKQGEQQRKKQGSSGLSKEPPWDDPRTRGHDLSQRQSNPCPSLFFKYIFIWGGGYRIKTWNGDKTRIGMEMCQGSHTWLPMWIP